MMEQPSSCDVDLEEGELSDSSEDGYTPLQRPVTLTTCTSPNTTGNTANTTANAVTEECSPLATCHQMQKALEEDESQSELSDSSSGESSDSCLKKLTSDGKQLKRQRKCRKRVKRTVMVRVQPTDADATNKRARFKKYNIWTAALQEDSLTENMRECDVTLKGITDRNVENYDFSIGYRLNGENSLKRRLSTSTDDLSDGELHSSAKRGRRSDRDSNDNTQKRTVKSRLGYRSNMRGRRSSSASSGTDCFSFEPRRIMDLDDPMGRDPTEVALEIANKLDEKKADLLTRIVDVLGIDLPVEIYKETQRIEAEGGLMINNGKRRRTPGGVFLFLVKNSDKISAEDHKSIFVDDQKATNKWRKVMKSLARDRKVEELKKRLNEKEKELSTMMTRKEHFLLGSELSLENQTSLSNPPPSPVGQESNFEYKPHAINLVASDVNTEKDVVTSPSATLVSTSAGAGLVTYDDSFLDINCGEMDFV